MHRSNVTMVTFQFSYVADVYLGVYVDFDMLKGIIMITAIFCTDSHGD
jgi:hypothetical protein